jgi:hypothetical protein
MIKSLVALAVLTLASTAFEAHAGSDGISYLIAVTQIKADNANDAALGGAEKQRQLIKKQQQLRARQAALDALVADGKVSQPLDVTLNVCDICSLVVVSGP